MAPVRYPEKGVALPEDGEVLSPSISTSASSITEDIKEPPAPALEPIASRKSWAMTRPSFHSHSRSSNDTDPLEPLEAALSQQDLETPQERAQRQLTHINTAATAATGTSAWSRPPDFEVTFGGGDDRENPMNWSLPYRMWVIFTVSFSTWVIVLYSTSYTAAMPGLIAEFHSETTIVTLGVTTYLLGLAVGSLVFAPMSELYGRRPVYLICQTISALLILPCALATSLEEILIVRFFG